MALRFLTAGESHGPALTVIVEGVPAGLHLDPVALRREMRRRMAGYGRGGRMQIEDDEVEVTAGLRFGATLGSPVAMVVRNRDHESWQVAMRPHGPRPSEAEARGVTRPRPGHADLAGALKYRTHDARDVFERSSARETAARTAAGAVARALLREVGIEVTSRTAAVGRARAGEAEGRRFDALLDLPDDAPFRVLDGSAMQRMIAEVEGARAARDSIGGVFEVLARGVPPGLGSHAHWDRRLDGRIGGALLSIQAVKAVEIGDGVAGARKRGSALHDPIRYDARARRFRRPSNRAGGIEGGMSNGEMLRARAWLKPLATLPRPLESVDLVSKETFEAVRERTDTVPIVAAGVVGEAMVALVLADEVLRKFGGDSVAELRENAAAYARALEDY